MVSLGQLKKLVFNSYSIEKRTCVSS